MTDTSNQRHALDVALIRLYRSTRDPRRLDRLVERFTPLVRTAVRPYLGRGEPDDDLLQVGMLALLKAIERFEPGGNSFGSFALPTIDGELKRHFRDYTWAVKVPRSMQELQAKVGRARTAWPGASATEIADHLGITTETLREADRARDARQVRSLDFATSDEPDAPTAAISVHDPGYDDLLVREQVADALSALSPRDREIVELRFFDERLQREIGAGVGVSQMQVSRVLNRALETMREHLAASGDAPPDTGQEVDQ